MSRTVRQGGLGSASSGVGSLQTPLRVAVPAGARQRLLLRDLHVGTMKLLAKPRKMPSMAGFGLQITGYLEG